MPPFKRFNAASPTPQRFVIHAYIGNRRIVVGVAISLMDRAGGKIKHSKEEVPIYEGVGKDRRIVGYRKD
jgi:hypothetical protein